MELNYATNTKHTCYREYKNIDVYITDGNKHIILENKVYAKDQPKQIERYVSEITNNGNKDLKVDDILVVYLSLDRRVPSDGSLGNLSIDNGIVKRVTKLKNFQWSQSNKQPTLRDFNCQWMEFCNESIALFKSIHYKNEILIWLKECKYEVQNITNLNEVFRQYIDVVKMINNQYEDKIMSLSDYITENESVYKLAIELKKELPKARKNIIDEFFNKITSSLEEKLGTGWTVILNEKHNLFDKFGIPITIYKDSWVKENSFIFGFEFGKDDYSKGYFGIVRNNSSIDVKGDIVDKFKSILEKCTLNTTEGWLHHEYLNNMDDFPTYIMLNKNAEEKFIDEVMNLIRKFELESNLITEINSYLNNKNKI